MEFEAIIKISGQSELNLYNIVVGIISSGMLFHFSSGCSSKYRPHMKHMMCRVTVGY
jgi:hypothetical protein